MFARVIAGPQSLVGTDQELYEAGWVLVRCRGLRFKELGWMIAGDGWVRAAVA